MKEIFLEKAEENLPEIIKEDIVPDVCEKTMDNGDELVLDLGNHRVGYFSFRMDWIDRYIDAPVRLYVKFCETKREIEDDFSKYKGVMCLSWLQEEIINIDFPGVYSMPRRYAARYVVIKVLNTPQILKLSDFKFVSQTSADESALEKAKVCSEELLIIDKVSVNTLRNCMQRVFEDGPKRDRRLWIGDLRLEALTNYYTFNNLKLSRRCLYLFAAADKNKSGFIPGYIYENPVFVSGEWFLVDYALLFVATLCDYYTHSGDKETFDCLYNSAKSQIDAAGRCIDDDGIIFVPNDSDVFIDWCEALEKTTALHGVYLYVLKKFTDTLSLAGYDDAEVYKKRYQEAKESALKVLYDKENKRFTNAKDGYQHSVHSVVWMILGGVLSGDEAKQVLKDAINSGESIKPFTPYMHHYVVEAMLEVGMEDEAEKYIKEYWGGMIRLGADTFFEVYVPDDAEFSPYGDRMINSMCHAWSCTPSYFIRKYLAK